jgi:hypothetical protein
LAGCIDRGFDVVRVDLETIRGYVHDLAEVAATLDPAGGTCVTRRERFEDVRVRFPQSGDSTRQTMARVMTSFVAGLFVGDGTSEDLRDNLDRERWFRLPKSHERRIHGHRHAGVRIVQEGPTLVHALDAHRAHPEPFTAEDLLPHRAAREPLSQKQAKARRKIMRKARSKKQRPLLLADLERRYRETASL